MLFERRLQAGLTDGTITVALRRWKRPQALPGRRYRSPVGMVAVTDVQVVDVIDALVEETECFHPGLDVAAAITPRQPDVLAHGQRDVPARAPDFVGELHAGRRRAHHQHAAIVEIQGAPANGRSVRLGPEPLIGAQRVTLIRGDHRISLVTDGLRPFSISKDGA